jgi:uncharacterized protein with GYD domain
MPHYLFRARYTQAGIQGVMKEGGTARGAAVQTMVESLGGQVLAQYWAFGEDDYIAIADLPDNVTAMALAATVGATGAVSVTTTVLLSADEVDAMTRLRGTYRAPGA